MGKENVTLKDEIIELLKKIMIYKIIAWIKHFMEQVYNTVPSDVGHINEIFNEEQNPREIRDRW